MIDSLSIHNYVVISTSLISQVLVTSVYSMLKHQIEGDGYK